MIRRFTQRLMQPVQLLIFSGILSNFEYMAGICRHSMIPVRFQPSERSEQITQLLFGEMYEVLDELDEWLLIRTIHDGYEGWISNKTSYTVDNSFFDKCNDAPLYLTTEICSQATEKKTSVPVHLVMGSVLPCFQKDSFLIGDSEFEYHGSALKIPSVPDLSQVTRFASAYLNVPYLWGGRSCFGIDCSGFSQMVFRFCGINLPRDASQQVTMGETIDFIAEARSGDLAFFNNEAGTISHVGILLGDNKIIHASGFVRIDTIDHFGIFNHQSGRYSHILRTIRRIG